MLYKITTNVPTAHGTVPQTVELSYDDAAATTSSDGSDTRDVVFQQVLDIITIQLAQLTPPSHEHQQNEEEELATTEPDKDSESQTEGSFLVTEDCITIDIHNLAENNHGEICAGSTIEYHVHNDRELKPVLEHAAETFGYHSGTARVMFEGYTVKPSDTPADISLGDGDALLFSME